MGWPLLIITSNNLLKKFMLLVPKTWLTFVVPVPKRGIVPPGNTVMVILNGNSDWQVVILCALLNQLGEKDITSYWLGDWSQLTNRKWFSASQWGKGRLWLKLRDSLVLPYPIHWLIENHLINREPVRIHTLGFGLLKMVKTSVKVPIHCMGIMLLYLKYIGDG